MPRAPQDNSVETMISKRIKRSVRGTVFVPDSFVDYGSRAAIDKSLQRLVAKGLLRRLSRGLYDKPDSHPLLGVLWPSVDSVVKVITARDRTRTQPIGVYAENILGLSTQVPAKVVLLTDGLSRTIKYGPMDIRFVRTTPRQMAAAGKLSGLLIQAFRSIGKERVTQVHIDHLKAIIPASERIKLGRDITLAPGWMRTLLEQISEI